MVCEYCCLEESAMDRRPGIYSPWGHKVGMTQHFKPPQDRRIQTTKYNSHESEETTDEKTTNCEILFRKIK